MVTGGMRCSHSSSRSRSRDPPRTTADLLLEWDRRRPRTQQREIGWSDIGGCRRRAGYRLAGTEPSNPGGSIQAVLGTAIHNAISGVLAEIAEPGDLVEHEVRFGGIKGHLDRYEAATLTVRDVKSTSKRWLTKLKANGPPQDNLWQLHGYAAALIAAGYKVRRVALDYIARDTGECWTWEQPFDPTHVRDALAWVDEVRTAPLEMLPRDYDPDGPFCKGCPFFLTCWEGYVPNRDMRSVLYVEHPDGAGWIDKLEQARADKADAERREKEAKGALDAVRPNGDGRSDPVDVGHDTWQVQWTVSSFERIDTDAVRAEYAAAGATPPMQPSGRTTLSLVRKEQQ